MRIVVTGLAATYPFGGVFWDYLFYILGFHRMGHEVLYLEDTRKWNYDPVAQTFVESASTGAELLASWLPRLDPGLSDRWFVRDGLDRTYGMPEERAMAFCREADLFLHMSDNCYMREDYFEARHAALLDSDPWYTTATLPGEIHAKTRARGHMTRMVRHDSFLTFGEKVGDADCRICTERFDWMPTRQPIVIDALTPYRIPVEERRRVFTTVASWEPKEEGPVVDGVQYGGKSREMARFLDIARRVPGQIELALSGKAPIDRLEASGFLVRHAYEISHDPWVYAGYLANSLGEWSVAKNAYVAGRTGWFSGRTACYLALGVPAVVQDTGFSDRIPTGEGLFAFETEDQALAGLDTIRSDPRRHADAALEIAREYFDHQQVLSTLLDRCIGTERRAIR